MHTLLRCREHKFAVSADIEGMFLQVGVLEHDQPYIQILWRYDTNDDNVVYPYVRQMCATEKRRRYFKLIKFVSNFPALTAELKASELPFDTKQTKRISDILGTSSPVLRLKWDHSNDNLVVSRRINEDVPSSLTQRAALSLVAAVFDPIGLVAPFTVRARLLLKDVWRVSGQQCYDQLSTDTAQQITERINELPRLSEMTIPRSYFTVDVDQIELHLLGDSSQVVFSTVAFLRGRPCVATNGNPFLSFVIGKALQLP